MRTLIATLCIITISSCARDTTLDYFQYSFMALGVTIEVPNINIQDISHYTRDTGGESLIIVCWDGDKDMIASIWIDCCPNDSAEIEQIKNAWAISDGQWVRDGDNAAYLKSGAHVSVVVYVFGQPYGGLEENPYYLQFDPEEIKIKN